jgi:hypothetical protein
VNTNTTYKMTDEYSEKFRKECGFDGNFELAKFIYADAQKHGVDIDLNMNNGVILYNMCSVFYTNGLEPIKFIFEKLHETGKQMQIDIEVKLPEGNIYNVKSYEDIFFRVLMGRGIDRLNIAKWLYENSLVNNGKEIDITCRDNYAFCCFCGTGSIEGIEWVLSFMRDKGIEIDIHMDNDKPFRWACHNNCTVVMDWLENKANEHKLTFVYVMMTHFDKRI